MSDKFTEFLTNIKKFKGLFGEGPAERRERLRVLISKFSDDEIARKLRKKEELEKKEEESQNVNESARKNLFTLIKLKAKMASN